MVDSIVQGRDYVAGIVGIGGYLKCGTITIENATVYAYATAISPIVCPAIGSLYMIPTIIISNNSEVYAHRGFEQNPSPADWIGIGILDKDGSVIKIPFKIISSFGFSLDNSFN